LARHSPRRPTTPRLGTARRLPVSRSCPVGYFQWRALTSQVAVTSAPTTTTLARRLTASEQEHFTHVSRLVASRALPSSQLSPPPPSRQCCLALSPPNSPKCLVSCIIFKYICLSHHLNPSSHPTTSNPPVHLDITTSTACMHPLIMPLPYLYVGPHHRVRNAT
jgi:hypothetical protein